MRRTIPAVSLAGFGLIVLGLFLPFVRVSCGGDSVADLTGVQLVTGVEQVGRTDESEGEDIRPSFFAIAILAAAVAGLVMSFPQAAWAALLRMVFSGAGFLGVLLLMLEARSRAAAVTEHSVAVAFLWPCWATGLAFLAILSLNSALRGSHPD